METKILISENEQAANNAIKVLSESLPAGQIIAEATKEAIRESFRLYVVSIEGKELYNRHKAAIQALNNLTDLYKQHQPGQISTQGASDVFFPLKASAQKFELPVLDYDNLTKK